MNMSFEIGIDTIDIVIICASITVMYVTKLMYNK